MLGIGTTATSLLPRWLRRGEGVEPDALRRRLELHFLYRGVSTLELRTLAVSGRSVEVAFYARPIFPNDRRIQNRTRESAFAEQLFQDAVTVLNTIWRHAAHVDTVTLSAWLKTVDGVGREIPVLTTHATRQQAAGLPAGGRLGPIDILRRYASRTGIDRHGNFHPERAL